MFEGLINGFKLGSATRKLVFQDKRLLLYPILMGVLALIEFAVLFVGSLIVSGGIAAFTSGNAISATIVIAVILFYIISAFTTTYLTIAMLLAFRSFVKGKSIGMGEALSQARPYLGLALEWAIFYAIIVMVLNAIESRFRGIANIIVSAIGSMALAAAIVFAIPAIVDNKVGPIKAVEISAKTLISHFGSTFGGVAYSEIWSLAISLLGFLVIICGIFGATASAYLAIPVIGTGIVIFAFGAILGFALSNIFRFVLYEYVNGRPLPKGFDADLIKRSIKQRRGGTAVL